MTRARLVASILFPLLVGCGTDVNLGGTSDAGLPDADVDADLPGDCEPCLVSSDCSPNATCGVYSGDTFCATLCPTGNGCESDETCTQITVVGAADTKACVPTNGVCAPITGPIADGSAIDRCGVLNGPTVASACHACGKYSNDCQANGCYGGYWCNTSTKRCGKPPTSCP